MFSNPFDSFHNRVAEAKQEREQLDRLLTISTPRERLLLAAIALLLLVVAAWLFFGNVADRVAVSGILVEPAGDDQSVQALIWVGSGVATHSWKGMPAVIEVAAADGDADAIGGTVGTISPVSLSDDLAALEAAGPVSVHRVDITLATSLDLASLASRECRIVIELGRRSPVSVFRMRRS